MPLLPSAPFDRILLAMEKDAEGVDYLDLAGVPGPFKIRHRRKRNPMRGERPCHTLIFVGDEAVQGETGLSTGEIVRLLTVDMQTDMELPVVLSEAIDAPDDKTGLATLSRTQAAAIAAMRHPESETMKLVDWVIEGDVEPEDRAQAEDGRLVRSLVLQYRVSSVDGNVLLAAGENA
jgi:hypothetical protein